MGLAIVLVAAVPQGAYAAGGDVGALADLDPIVIESIPDQNLEIYPGIAPIRPTTVPLTIDQADADVTVRTTSTDKATVVLKDGELVVTPRRAGTTYVKVSASKQGFASVEETFAVRVVSKTDSGGYDWSGYAKIGGSGYVTGSVFSEIEEDVLYAKTDIGGAYRYDFERDYWVGLNDDATDHSAAYNPDDPRGPGRGATFVISIVPDPVKKGRVYMAAGGSQTNAAIYRSENYGETWKRFPIATNINGNDQSNRSTGERLAVDPKNNNIVYFASQTAGLWKSTNAGQSFTRITDGDDLAVNYRPTFVTVDPNSPVDEDGSSTRVVVGTIGAVSNTPPTVGVDPMQQRPYKSLFVSNDGGDSFAELAGQPAARPDRRYGGFVAQHFDWDWTGGLVVSYAEFGLNGFNGVGSNSNFALDGRVVRFDLAAGTSQDVTPDNVYTKEHADLTETDIANGQVMQRGGIGGISVDNQRPGVMVASSFHRHANYSEEVVWYTNNFGVDWDVIHSEVVGVKDLRGYGYIDKDNGWGAAVHWAFNIQLNPYDSDMALFTTGNGFWMTKNLTAADEPLTAENQVVWGFWNDGLEETVIWNLYSPTQTTDYVYSTYADWGSMSWGKDTTVSPKNSLVNRESPANRVKYLDPPFDADGNPRYDLDEDGNVQLYLKDGYYERWMNTQNLDYAGLEQNVMVLTPSGNYQNTNVSAGVISFDEGKTATPLAVPSGVSGQGPSGTGNAGWIAVNADATTVVWSVGGQSIQNTYWTDISDGPDSAAVGSHDGRPQGSAEVRQVVKHGDREAWEKSLFFDTLGAAVTTGSVKIFSDKIDPDVVYAFRYSASSGAQTILYASHDAGRTFSQVTLAQGSLPATNWSTSGHSQGANKILVDVYRPYSVYLASNNAAAGLVHLTYDQAAAAWSATKVSPGTSSAFQQVGMGLGLGDNSVPALYAMGVIADNSSWPAQSPRYGAYRSFDGGATWTRVNDDQHQFGDLRALSGDSRVLGRVYIGTGSRGIRVGDIDWITDKGVDDRNTLTTLRLTADVSEAVAGQPIAVAAELVDPWGESLGDVTADTALTTTVEASTLAGTPSNPWVSLTYVITGRYTWTDDDGQHSVTSDPVRVEVFNVDALVPVITGTAAVGSTLTAQVPAGWPVTFEWLRDGVATGATGASYVPVVADAGASISVRTLLAKAGGVTKVSSGVTIAKLAATVKVTLPKASVTTTAKAQVDVAVSAPGTSSHGGTVTVTAGGATVTGTVAGGKASVTLPALAAKTHAVTVTYSGTAQVAAANGNTVNLKVTKVAPKVKAKLAKKSVKASKKARVVVTVKATGVKAPTGKVTVKFGKRTTTVTLKAAHNGKVRVTLPKLTKGTYTIKVTYAGDAVVAKKVAKVVKLKVK